MAEKKILIVDDEDHIRELLKFNLEKNGYVVYMANDGLNGLKLAREKQVDLILLDLMLPGMDGFEVCKEIRRDNIISNVPIIMLTAKSEEIDKILGLELGADDYITKPFSLMVLISKVNALMRRVSNESSNKRGIQCKHLKFYVDEMNLKDFGSQGQQRVAVLAFKLSEINLFKEIKKTYKCNILCDY